MRARPDRDRLAVCTYQEAGEEIPNGDPSVTDAERAAAGRETLAERFAAVLPGNRRRAAERYTAGGLPDGQDVARVWRPRDPAELRARLTEPPLAIWSSGDVLEVLWQGQADEVQLYGGVQPRLWPVEGTDDLWEVSLRIRRLDQAVISVVVASREAGGEWPRQIPDIRVWRGPQAPAVNAPRELRGSVSTHTLVSAALRGELTVYQPPGAGGRCRAACWPTGNRSGVRAGPGLGHPGGRGPARPAGRPAQRRRRAPVRVRPACPGVPARAQPQAFRRAPALRHRRGSPLGRRAVRPGGRAVGGGGFLQRRGLGHRRRAAAA